MGGSAVRSLYFGDKALDLTVAGRSSSNFDGFLGHNKIEAGEGGVQFKRWTYIMKQSLIASFQPST